MHRFRRGGGAYTYASQSFRLIRCGQFGKYIPTFYPLVTDILSKEVALEMRLAVRDYLHRVGIVKRYIVKTGGMDERRESVVLWSPEGL